MKDYPDQYIKYDVFLLAVFEKCRNNSLNNHGLCLVHYLSVPRLSCDVRLKMTKNELQLIPDPAMYIFYEKGTRGGGGFVHGLLSCFLVFFVFSCCFFFVCFFWSVFNDVACFCLILRKFFLSPNCVKKM